MNYYFDSFLGQLKGRHCTRQLFNWPIVALAEIKSAESLSTTKKQDLVESWEVFLAQKSVRHAQEAEKITVV